MSEQIIVIIDYGSGNLRSAAKSFERVIADENLKARVVVSAHPKDIKSASRIVLPGQGAFGDCMDGLLAIDGMVETLNENVLKEAKPFLGICVGMQLMATRGLEHGAHAGLDWIPGEVVPIKPENLALKIPHMGWNSLSFPRQGRDQDNKHFVLRSTESAEDFYFVHSFVFQCLYNLHILAYVDYGGLIPAIVGRDNMIGVQFHPEKSHTAGLKLLSEFLQWRP